MACLKKFFPLFLYSRIKVKLIQQKFKIIKLAVFYSQVVLNLLLKDT